MNAERADPRAYLKALMRWKFLFLACVVVVPLLAYVVTSREPRVFQSSALVQEGAIPSYSALLGEGAASSSVGKQTLSGQARVIETPSVAKVAAQYISPPARRSTLEAAISAKPDTETGFISLTAKAASGKRAAAIANAYAEAVVALRTGQVRTLLSNAANQISRQLAQHRSGGSEHEHEQLTSQLARLRAMRASTGADAQILQPAVASATPISPKVHRAVGLGLLAGLLLGIGAVAVAQSADRRIRHPEDLEELTGLPLLAVIPNGAFSEDVANHSHDEAFHTLRSSLMYFNIDKPLSSIMVSSPMKGDGKTTVATHLALAAARAGRDVLLVDADLRRPQAANRLHVQGEVTKSGHGLAGVLTGQLALGDALVNVPLRPADEDEPEAARVEGGRLRLLPAGGKPPNPSELLASRRMRDLLDEFGRIADLTIIDTNPLLSVSDSLPLFDAVTGIVVIARLNATSRDALFRLQKTIANTAGNLLGVVATGAVPTGLYGYYSYGYGNYYDYTVGGDANGNGNGSGRLPGRLAHLGRPRKVKQKS